MLLTRGSGRGCSSSWGLKLVWGLGAWGGFVTYVAKIIYLNIITRMKVNKYLIRISAVLRSIASVFKGNGLSSMYFHYSVMDSTNDHAKRLIQADIISKSAVIIADIQTHGRTRKSNKTCQRSN